VSSIGAPAHLVAKFLNQLFLQYTSFKPKFGVKNSLELVEKIKDIAIPKSSRLVYFDVVNLFTNVTPLEATDLAVDMLKKLAIPENIISKFSTLLKIVVSQN
jgi:hypothetical protein